MLPLRFKPLWQKLILALRFRCLVLSLSGACILAYGLLLCLVGSFSDDYLVVRCSDVCTALNCATAMTSILCRPLAFPEACSC